jgi:hypothetical protein
MFRMDTLLLVNRAPLGTLGGRPVYFIEKCGPWADQSLTSAPLSMPLQAPIVVKPPSLNIRVFFGFLRLFCTQKTDQM